MYKPIADHGVIGNLRTSALVGRDGSIDWLCLPDVDSGSVFAAILDHLRGGRFRVAPARPAPGAQRYRGPTNVLETAFDTGSGRLVITDFMPLRGSLDGADHETAPEVVRLLRAEDGAVDVVVEWAPRFDYARALSAIHATPGGFLAESARGRLSLSEVPGARVLSGDDGPLVRATFSLAAGAQMALATRWDTADAGLRLSDAQRSLAETLASWLAWVGKEQTSGDRGWAGPYREAVIRSELALKLMTYAPTAAIVAAPTTSLPETLGGVRNWDYRYSWIRDSSLAAQALFAMGHRREAEAFVNWAERSAFECDESGWGAHIMYDVRGDPHLPEQELPHLEGYAGSSPVRVGNGAAEQIQLDVYGELLGAAHEVVRLGGCLEAGIWPFLSHLAGMAIESWTQNDAGIWEMRGATRPFTYSKVMIWAALDRALRLAGMGLLTGDIPRWEATRQLVREEVLSRGYSQKLGAFTLTYDDDEDLDAANLLIPMLGLLPCDDPRVQSTIDRTLERLTVNDLVYRYRADDGLPGEEGAFVLCTFWLVDTLAVSGRLDEAHRIFETLLAHASPLSLLSEQIDPHTGALLGNFPQAFSHIGVINSALYLSHMSGRETPIPAPIGTAPLGDR